MIWKCMYMVTYSGRVPGKGVVDGGRRVLGPVVVFERAVVLVLAAGPPVGVRLAIHGFRAKHLPRVCHVLGRESHASAVGLEADGHHMVVVRCVAHRIQVALRWLVHARLGIEHTAHRGLRRSTRLVPAVMQRNPDTLRGLVCVATALLHSLLEGENLNGTRLAASNRSDDRR